MNELKTPDRLLAIFYSSASLGGDRRIPRSLSRFSKKLLEKRGIPSIRNLLGLPRRSRESMRSPSTSTFVCPARSRERATRLCVRSTLRTRRKEITVGQRVWTLPFRTHSSPKRTFCILLKKTFIFCTSLRRSGEVLSSARFFGRVFRLTLN
jgi:hypothetical protein